MNRGDRREPIFKDDEDHRRFLETLGEACGKTGWQVHAYCLMPNHFHLVVETPQPNLVAGMKWCLRHLHLAVQPAAQALWPFVQWPLQIVDCGWQRRWLFADGV